MLIRMCSIMAGPLYGNARYGDIVKVPTEVGEEMVKQRHATPYVVEEAKAPKAKKERRGGRRSGRDDTTGGRSDHAD